MQVCTHACLNNKKIVNTLQETSTLRHFLKFNRAKDTTDSFPDQAGICFEYLDRKFHFFIY